MKPRGVPPRHAQSERLNTHVGAGHLAAAFLGKDGVLQKCFHASPTRAERKHCARGVRARLVVCARTPREYREGCGAAPTEAPLCAHIAPPAGVCAKVPPQLCRAGFAFCSVRFLSGRSSPQLTRATGPGQTGGRGNTTDAGTDSTVWPRNRHPGCGAVCPTELY